MMQVDSLSTYDLKIQSGFKESINGYRLHPVRIGTIWRIRCLRGASAAGVIMIVAALYVAGAIGVTVYMLVALLRPEKF
jgi:hypothetical protein